MNQPYSHRLSLYPYLSYHINLSKFKKAIFVLTHDLFQPRHSLLGRLLLSDIIFLSYLKYMSPS